MTEKDQTELLKENADLYAANIKLRTQLMHTQSERDRAFRLLGEALLFGSPQYDAAGNCLGYLADEPWMTRVEALVGPLDPDEEDD